MASKVKGIPEGASVVIPRSVCRDPAAMIEFCASTFGAGERVRRPGPDGSVAHTLMTIGPAMVMIESEWPTLPSRPPTTDHDDSRKDCGATTITNQVKRTQLRNRCVQDLLRV